ncbi:hypothetical protein [Paenibacillus agilis]|uniref:CBM-cenC domain-containing protein n=1 Tax=Paenibacillus agilis TaxID=3020863 RepID=A0A559IX75_9BACL|nr:hypothetical protein [Paenibacillus agilis]TVX92196.1 hypothetical protein FPZ44_03465 [Paenibacillus agilis]
MKSPLKKSFLFFLCLSIFALYGIPQAIAAASEYIYDNNGKLQSTKTPEFQYDYHYDQNGNIVRITKSTDVNLLRNHSFETYNASNGVADNWGSYIDNTATGTFALDGEISSHGTKSQKMHATNLPKGTQMLIYQDVKSQAGIEYNVSGRYRIDALSHAKVDLFVDFLDSSKNFIDAKMVVSYNHVTPGFITLSTHGVTPEKTAFIRVHAVIRAGNEAVGNGLVYVDSMSVKHTYDPNVVSNPSFEEQTEGSNLAAGWGSHIDPEVVGTFGLDPLGSNGDKSQFIRAEHLPVGTQMLIYQDIHAEAGKAYTVSGRYQIEKLKNARVDLFVDFLDSSNNFINAKKVESYSNNTKGYITLTNSGITPPNTAFIRLYAVIRSTASTPGAGVVHVDSMSLHYNNELNMISNPSFEGRVQFNGLAADWGSHIDQEASGSLSVVKQTTSHGTYAQKITASKLPKGTQMLIYQDIHAEGGQAYQINGQFHIESLQHARIDLYVDYFDSSNAFINTNTFKSYSEATKQFITLSAQTTTPQNTAYVRVYAVIRATGDRPGSGVVYVDSMEMKKR